MVYIIEVLVDLPYERVDFCAHLVIAKLQLSHMSSMNGKFLNQAPFETRDSRTHCVREIVSKKMIKKIYLVKCLTCFVKQNRVNFV